MKKEKNKEFRSLKNEKSDIFTTLLMHRCFLENNLWKNKKFLKKSESFLIKNHIF